MSEGSRGRMPATAFDVGIDERIGVLETLALGFQNIFGMTGMFVFPAIIGLAYHLPAAQIGYLYGATFVASGLVTVLQSVLGLRLPIVQGPYAGTFAMIVVAGKLGIPLGTTFGSLALAGVVWAALAFPIRGFSLIGIVARYAKSPLIYGTLLIVIMTQLAGVTLPNWIGTPERPGFGAVNLASGALAVVVFVACTVWGPRLMRRGATLLAVLAGTLLFGAFVPIDLSHVAHAPLIEAPRIFPFGVGLNAELFLIFFVTFVPAIAESIAMYEIVAEWGEVRLSPARVSFGVFGEVLGSAIGATLGAVSTLAYPDNVGLLRATRVGSRYVTLATGAILMLLGSIVKFDLLLVAVPLPIIAAVGAVLFGMILMSGIQMLGRVDWDDRNLIVAGFPFMVAIGGLFVPETTLHELPLFARVIVQQPLISAVVLLGVLDAVLNRGRRAAATLPLAARTPLGAESAV
ncbi:MAG: putative transrane protein xanthine/uracil permease family protein [Candidatus Eremiobacteraeota bacterium]|nr:putative transrane protein xanthine/uracil permease family protein [Candidatus Eremiobacteraeota bacterium]